MKTRPNTITQFRDYGTIILPGGLRCHEIKEGATAGKFFLDQFPEALFPRGSIKLHDAVHYGVVLDREQVDAGSTTVSITFDGEHFADSFKRLVKSAIEGRCGAKAIYCAICRALRDGKAKINIH